jgi:hypothetical protein
VVSKLAQRSAVRALREVLLRDEKKYQDSKHQIHNPDSANTQERELVGAGVSSGLRRAVNGRSW